MTETIITNQVYKAILLITAAIGVLGGLYNVFQSFALPNVLALAVNCAILFLYHHKSSYLGLAVKAGAGATIFFSIMALVPTASLLLLYREGMPVAALFYILGCLALGIYLFWGSHRYIETVPCD